MKPTGRSILMTTLLCLALLSSSVTSCAFPFGAASTLAGSDSPTAATSDRPDHDLIFDRSRIVDYYLTIPPDNWEDLQDSPVEYVSGTFRFEDEEYRPVGVRFKGNVSLGFAGDKPSFKVKFSEYNRRLRFHGLERLNLNNGFKDPTILREILAYDLYSEAGSLASRTSHVRVYVSVLGLYDQEYFGLYISVEQVDEAFLRDRFGNADGNLYKGGDFRWHGPEAGEYVPVIYQPRGNRQVVSHAALVHFLDVLNNAADAGFKEEIEKVFHVATS